MSSSKSSEGSRGNTNEDDNEDKNELEDDNEDSTEEQGGEPYTHIAHAAEKDEEQSGEWRAQHPPGVCSRPHLREQQRRLAKHARYLLSMLTHAQWGYLRHCAGANRGSHL